jgi:hypothetical protein
VRNGEKVGPMVVEAPGASPAIELTQCR